MRGLGLHTIDPAEYLGPQRGALGAVDINAQQIGVVPFYLLAFAIPAVGGGIAGAVVAPAKKKLSGSAIGALGAGVGGLTTILLLKALSA